MCFGAPKAQAPETPAAAPAAPLAAADAPKIGQTRRDENIRNFGSDEGPNYRVRAAGAGDEEDYRVADQAGIRM